MVFGLGHFRFGVTAAKLDRDLLPSRHPLGTLSNDLRILCGNSSQELSEYQDQQFGGGNEEHERLLKESSTLYVGNLSFYTTEEHIFELFSRCGDVKNIFMGLDKTKNAACNFCFVEYHNRADAENALWFLNGTRLDDRTIRVDWDLGFRVGRRYGRRSRGQVQDEFRDDVDAGRGGFGRQTQAGDRRGVH
ncbi:nuclear cap-binding protein subunit 2-like [Diceros bicornis minor]|uniref:nuclear cap-binding protein subunit 2-like n=1 Tax=Diceros bicornis minor TaxID=77932 RepID=UPI0026EF0AB4|nr:nuclear cap-binding protein subunit 2-like [Diceros bicornis minor]